MVDKPDLKSAYALRSDTEVEALYAEWAETYDASFSDAQGYQIPKEVALAFVKAGGQGAVLDVGAGTGLVAEYLTRADIIPIDAVDLSVAMLDVAAAKGIYQALHVADVTKPLTMIKSRYQGIVSAGTFTHGHVGPEGLRPLIDVAESGALFVLSINRQHFERLKFQDEIDALGTVITDVRIEDVRIYDDRADADHRNDVASLLMFSRV